MTKMVLREIHRVKASPMRVLFIVVAGCNKQLQRTVMHKVPTHLGQRAAAELRR
jgi:hypothetical protein